MDELIAQISRAIYYKFDGAETSCIKQILDNNDADEREKANTICDLIGVERRSNRALIEGEIYKHINTQRP